ncbi:MAG: hypothetical protein ACHQT9_04010 [Candidatus Saccharimonadales bacterium]
MRTFEGNDEGNFGVDDIVGAVPSDDTLRADIDSATGALPPVIADEIAAREAISRVKSIQILGMLEERGVASARVVLGEFTKVGDGGDPLYKDMSGLAWFYDSEFTRTEDPSKKTSFGSLRGIANVTYAASVALTRKDIEPENFDEIDELVVTAADSLVFEIGRGTISSSISDTFVGILQEVGSEELYEDLEEIRS